MMNKSLPALCAKTAFFAGSFFLLLWPLARTVHQYEIQYEPREALFHDGSIGRYPFVLMGSSVFCSVHVDDDRETIWNKFGSFTGQKCFPGALSGARDGDFLGMARYIADNARKDATVFIDITPVYLATYGKAKYRADSYPDEIGDLLAEKSVPGQRLYNYMNLDYLDHVRRLLRRDKKTGESQFHDRSYNIVWNGKSDFARNRYELLLPDITGPSVENMDVFQKIHAIFRAKNINAVYVLTPLNKKVLYAFSPKKEADFLRVKLDRLHDRAKLFLDRRKIPYIDLFCAVPDSGFADLVHTNASGDEVIARALAEYASNGPKSGKKIQ